MDAALKYHFSIHFRALLQLIILQVYPQGEIHECKKSEFIFLQKCECMYVFVQMQLWAN